MRRPSAPAAVPSPPPSAQRAGRRVVISGFGLLTPLGHAAWPTFTALLAGRTLSDRATPLMEADHPVDPVNLVRVLGGVSIVQHAATDPAVELADRAAREAAFAAGVDPRGLPTYLGTSKGAVHAWTRCTERLRTPPATAGGGAGLDLDRGDPAAHEIIPLGAHGYLTHQLRRRLGILPQRHVVAACASALTALDHARQALLHGSIDRAMVVTAEAALLPQFVHSYRRLGVLAPLTPTHYRQRPLDADQHRQGFMLSEAGAAVLLERLPPGAEAQPGQIELCDTATAAEAHDLVRSDPNMQALAHVAGRLLGRAPVDVIHPHAPGTAEHDPAELTVYRHAARALRASASQGPTVSAAAHQARDRACASAARGASATGAAAAPLPDIYACKGALGHSLGASGLVSLVLACLCLHAGRRPPMPWLETPLPSVEPAAQPCSRSGVHAVFAAGFGGHVAGAVIRRH